MKVFDGRKLAQEILDELKKEVDALDKKPSLAVVSFGDGQSSFIKRKQQTAEFLGIGFKQYAFGESMSAKEVRRRLNLIAKSPSVSAIVLQLPLPGNISSAVLNIIPPEKDPDILSDRAVGYFFNNRSGVEPPTAAAILMILSRAGVKIKNSTISIFGYGKLVGRFLVSMLLARGAKVRVAAQSLSDDEIKDFVAGSDIVVSAVGQAHFLKAELLPAGAKVVDAGFSTLDPVRNRPAEGTATAALGRPVSNGVDGSIVGDINFASGQESFDLIVPVPGGVGPVGVALLFKNIIKLSKK